MVDVDDALPVEAFAPVGHDHVDVAGLDQLLQLGVNGREGDVPAILHDEGVQILGAHEALHPAQDLDYLSALGGVSGRCHVDRLPAYYLLFGMVLSNVIGMILRKALLTLALALSSVGISACNSSAASRPLVVAGVAQWGALARQLVGSDAKVVSLLTDPNADPHDHEATVSDAAYVSMASIVVVNGAGYDTWFSQLAKARSGVFSTIDVGTLMGVAPGRNPHLFYNPVAAIRFVKALTKVLEHRKGFSDIDARSAALLAKLNTVQSEATAIKQSCSNVKVAATEDVTTYLLSDMGLKVVTPEALRLAIGNSVDPSVQALAQALHQLKEHPAFLVDNVQTATPLTNEMVAQAEASHVPVIKVTETMKGTNYVTWIGAVVGKIHADLTKEGCLT